MRKKSPLRSGIRSAIESVLSLVAVSFGMKGILGAHPLNRLLWVATVSLVACCLVAPPSSGQITFEKWFGGEYDDMGYSVRRTRDGGYVVAGYATNVDPSWFLDMYVIRTDALGESLWTRVYGGTGDDRGHSVWETQDGGFIIAGQTTSFGSGPGDYDVYLVKIDPLGDTVWTRAYGGIRTDEGWSVQQTQDGGYVVAGRTASFGAGGYDFYLIKTDSLGDILWTRTYGGWDWDVAMCVQQTQDGGYIVAGTSASFRTGLDNDIYLVKTDSLGDTLWTRIIDGGSSEFGLFVQQTKDGGYIVTGEANASGTSTDDVYLIKTDSLGDTLWTRIYDGGKRDVGRCVQQTQDGGYIVVGGTHSFGNGKRDAYLIKTNSTGDSVWTRTFGGSESDGGWSVQQTQDCGYVIAGYTRSFGAGREDVYLIKTDMLGRVAQCQPMEPWQPRTQGYWRGVCRNEGKEDLCTYVEIVRCLADLFDDFDCDSICDLMNVNPPENDMCRKAKRQFMALLLNIASGKLAVCNCLDDGREVGDVVSEIDSLLSAGPDFHTCVHAKTLADDINNGIGIVPCDTTWIQAPPETVQPPSVLATPNPFTTSTVIEYEVKVPGHVRLDIYDKTGRLVRNLINDEQNEGLRRASWDGLSENRRLLPEGIYFFSLQSRHGTVGGSLIFLGRD